MVRACGQPKEHARRGDPRSRVCFQLLVLMENPFGDAPEGPQRYNAQSNLAPPLGY
jgi:hypothetical protein